MVSYGEHCRVASNDTLVFCFLVYSPNEEIHASTFCVFIWKWDDIPITCNRENNISQEKKKKKKHLRLISDWIEKRLYCIISNIQIWFCWDNVVKYHLRFQWTVAESANRIERAARRESYALNEIKDEYLSENPCTVNCHGMTRF